MNTRSVQEAALKLAYALMKLYDTQAAVRSLGYQVTESGKTSGRIAGNIQDAQRRAQQAEGHYKRLAGDLSTTVQDDKDMTIEFALYGLEGHYRAAGHVEIANAINLMGQRVDKSGNWDVSVDPHQFVNLTQPQYGWIVEATQRSAQAQREVVKEYEAKLAATNRETANLTKLRANTQKEELATRKAVAKLAAALDKMERTLWQERFGRVYKSSPADYTDLVILRLDLYEFVVRRVVSEYDYCLTKYAQPANKRGKFLIDMRRPEILEHQCVNIEVERVTPFHCIVYRPLSSAQKVQLKSTDRSHWQDVVGTVDENAVFEASKLQ